ncbi:MAG: nucleotidyltransferase domain-containing protein [Promethearchaeota archaeon]|jgi:hypothetical protein
MVGLREIAKSLKPTQIQKNQIRRYKNSIEKVLKNELNRYNIRIYYAGSYAKNTGMKNSLDLDLVIRFPSTIRNSIKECYELVYDVLRRNNWNPRRKNAAIRISNLSLPGETKLDHADIVPEKQISNSEYCNLWLNRENRALKTSVQLHLESIRELGMLDLIRLMKYWKSQHNLQYPSFILEQCLIRWAKDERKNSSKDIITRLHSHINYISRRIKNISLKDPANPTGNTLTNQTSFPTANKNKIARVANETYIYAKNQNWSKFFRTRF